MRIAAKLVVYNEIWKGLEIFLDGAAQPSTADAIIFLILAYYIFRREKERDKEWETKYTEMERAIPIKQQEWRLSEKLKERCRDLSQRM